MINILRYYFYIYLSNNLIKFSKISEVKWSFFCQVQNQKKQCKKEKVLIFHQNFYTKTDVATKMISVFWFVEEGVDFIETGKVYLN